MGGVLGLGVGKRGQDVVSPFQDSAVPSTQQVEFSILEASFLCPRTWEVGCGSSGLDCPRPEGPPSSKHLPVGAPGSWHPGTATHRPASRVTTCRGCREGGSSTPTRAALCNVQVGNVQACNVQAARPQRWASD